jgi:paraquat-inducible protein B
MSRRASPRAIGVFVLGALALLVGALAIFGGGRVFGPKETFVMFFEDDVGGLQVGAPVTFRGVRVGTVTDVRIRYDTDHQSVSIPVYVQLDRRQVVVTGERGWEEMTEMVKRGLRAQLKMQSFVTGQVAVDLDFQPRTPARLVGIISNYQEIPTVRSSISQLRATFSDLVEEVRKLPLDELIREVTTTSQNMAALLAHVDTLVQDTNAHVNKSFEDVPGLVRDARQMMADVNTAARDFSKLSRDLDKNVPEISQGAAQAVDRLNKTLDQAQVSLTALHDAVGDRSPLQYQMTQALTEITAAASSMRVLAEYLQQNPGVLLSGKGNQ